MKLTDLEIPVTPACRAALEVATAYCSPALLNHSVRAYLWAAGYGLAQDIAFDAELLYVSAMLHDLALLKEFDNHTLPFEEAGGHVAWVFGAAAGWPLERRRRAAETSCGTYGHLGSAHRGYSSRSSCRCACALSTSGPRRGVHRVL
jgi:hypothetical protein